MISLVRDVFVIGLTCLIIRPDTLLEAIAVIVTAVFVLNFVCWRKEER